MSKTSRTHGGSTFSRGTPSTETGPARAVMGAALALLVTLGACDTAATSSSSTSASPPLKPLVWGACPDDINDPPTVARPECSTLEVPLNYDKPNGTQIEIAISRIASPNPAKRRGVLLTNSGGPGGPGLRFAADLVGAGPNKLALPQGVQDSYDLIGMDPRGVGHSTPVTCDLSPEQKKTSNIPPYARNPADVTLQAEAAKKIATQCGSSKTASILPYITTANTARDLDRVRAALGEKKASYLGVSYGTYLGAVYTTLFPDSTDRVVLDSTVGPNGWDYAFQRHIAKGFQDRFPDFAAFAAAHPEYGLGNTPEQVTATYEQLLTQLDLSTAADGRSIGALVRQLTLSDLYYDKDFPILAGSLMSIINPGAAPATNPDTDSAPPSSTDNYLASQLHLLCNDSRWPTSLQTYQDNVVTDRATYPMFGAATANVSACAFWPAHPSEKPVTITDDGPANVLIAQNLRDPVTPLIGAQLMRKALGDRARLVTADQGGHLSYLFKGNQCLNNTVTQYLLDGTRPKQDVDCDAQTT